MGLVVTDGRMIASLPVSGSIAKLEDSVSTHGLMAVVMKASSSGTRDRAMEYT